MKSSSLVRVTAPAALPVDLPIVWAHLNALPLDSPDDAIFIAELVNAAVERLDGPDGLLNRALISQSWKASWSCFPELSTWSFYHRSSAFFSEGRHSLFRIPLARCQSVTSIEYVDAAGATQTLNSDQSLISGLNTDDCRIRTAPGVSWPAVQRDNPEAVTVTFVAGFGDSSEDIPAAIRLAIMQMVAAAYADREGAGEMSLAQPAASTVVNWQVFP